MWVKILISCNTERASGAGPLIFYSHNTYRKKVISESGDLDVCLNYESKV